MFSTKMAMVSSTTTSSLQRSILRVTRTKLRLTQTKSTTRFVLSSSSSVDCARAWLLLSLFAVSLFVGVDVCRVKRNPEQSNFPSGLQNFVCVVFKFDANTSRGKSLLPYFAGRQTSCQMYLLQKVQSRADC